MKALIRIAKKYRPVSGEVSGVRIEACVPNLAARRMKMTSKGPRATAEAVPSFRKPYLIHESMDFCDQDSIRDADMERFKKQLLWEGFTEFEFLSNDPKMTPEVKAKVDAILAKMDSQG
jgi:hypothetical protein